MTDPTKPCAVVAQNSPGAEGLESSGPRGNGRATATFQVETKPSILVSFAYADSWRRYARLDYWREIVLDSGVFTFRKKGERVDLSAFIDWVNEMKSVDPRVTDVFTLDQGGPVETRANTEALWKAGIEAMPVYHVGEPTSVLKGYARDFPKIAIGGSVGYGRRMEWAALCFREVWPKKIHGLGYGVKSLRHLPFHSVDCSSWSIRPCAYGKYPSMGGDLKSSGEKAHSAHEVGMSAEVLHELREEARARRLWSHRVPAEFLPMPSVRMVLSGQGGRGGSSEVASIAPDWATHKEWERQNSIVRVTR